MSSKTNPTVNVTTTKKINKTRVAVGGQVVGATTDTAQGVALQGVDVVTLRVSLRHPHKIDDIPDGNGGFKTVILPGLDDNLRGAPSGILTADGNAVFFQLPRSDWEVIQQMHGQEQMYRPWHGNPPLVAAVESVTAAKSGAYKDDIEATVTGLAPQDPAAAGVAESKKTSD